MKKITCLLIASVAVMICHAQSPVGRWKMIAHTIVYNGVTIDTHADFLKQKPCAANIFYEINTDGSYRLNASVSTCDGRYKSMQEKLYSKTKWRMAGNKLSISSTNFSVSDSYLVSFSGNKMTCTGTEGQGVIIYQKL